MEAYEPQTWKTGPNQRDNIGVVIRTFKDKATEMLHRNQRHRDFANIATVALRKLDALEAAVTLDDLRDPPGNHLEALRGEREGQYSIRINQQFRVCFRWVDNAAEDVEVVDYH